MKKAVLNLKNKNGKMIPDYLLIDAEDIPVDIPQISIIKGMKKSWNCLCFYSS